MTGQQRSCLRRSQSCIPGQTNKDNIECYESSKLAATSSFYGLPKQYSPAMPCSDTLTGRAHSMGYSDGIISALNQFTFYWSQYSLLSLQTQKYSPETALAIPGVVRLSLVYSRITFDCLCLSSNLTAPFAQAGIWYPVGGAFHPYSRYTKFCEYPHFRQLPLTVRQLHDSLVYQRRCQGGL